MQRILSIQRLTCLAARAAGLVVAASPLGILALKYPPAARDLLVVFLLALPTYLVPLLLFSNKHSLPSALVAVGASLGMIVTVVPFGLFHFGYVNERDFNILVVLLLLCFVPGLAGIIQSRLKSERLNRDHSCLILLSAAALGPAPIITSVFLFDLAT